jgi:hypothetical protein
MALLCSGSNAASALATRGSKRRERCVRAQWCAIGSSFFTPSLVHALARGLAKLVSVAKVATPLSWERGASHAAFQ